MLNVFIKTIFLKLKGYDFDNKKLALCETHPGKHLADLHILLKSYAA